MESPHVVIVGAGPGGLSAALQLAHAGARVTILEKQSWVGGRTATFDQENFRFDIGPTFFLYPRVLQEIFQCIGLDLMHEVPMRRLDPQYRISFAGGDRIDATGDIAAMEAQIASFSPADCGAITRYMRDNRIKLERFRPILEMPFNGLRDFLSSDLLGALPWLRPHKSLGQELSGYFDDPRLAIAFSFQSKYLGMSPFKCPSLFSILSFLEYEYGVFHPLGGCGQVSTRMAELARQRGVDIHLQEAVTGFTFDGKRPTVVHTNDASYAADAVIINADFAQAMHDLVPDSLRRRWTNARIENKKFSCSTFMLYLGIEGRYDQLPHHTIHIAEDYERNLRQIEQDFTLPDKPSFYVQNACISDPSLAPDGHSTLYVLVPVPHAHRNHQWNETMRRGYRELTLDHLSQIGLSDICQRIVTERCITPQTWESEFGLFRGATFNLAHNLAQMLHRRPHNRFEDLQGVYLVGGGTHPGSGLPVIYESSRITCKQLIPELGLDASFLDNPSTHPRSSELALLTGSLP